jgi:hypothetical protein
MWSQSCKGFLNVAPPHFKSRLNIETVPEFDNIYLIEGTGSTSGGAGGMSGISSSWVLVSTDSSSSFPKVIPFENPGGVVSKSENH